MRYPIISLVAVALAGSPAGLAAQDRSREPNDSISQREREVRRARGGAGLRVGAWAVSDLATPSGAQASTWPAFEVYWQKGMDRHLVLETGFGLWRRAQTSSGASGNEEIGSYVIPMMTMVKLYPMTGPEARFEPLLTAGAGFTLGVDDRETVSGGLLGGGASGGTVMVLGIGLKGGAGFEYHLSRAFGFQAVGGYQYIRFFEQVGGERTYAGPVAGVGFAYRFQY